MDAEILVIIVSFNGMQWIERCIGSVLSSSMPADILVIDNGSTDGTREWLQKKGIEVIRSSGNIGFGAANNIGMQRALEEGYSFVYLLNQDAWVLPDTFKLLTDAFFSTGGYGILSPIQYDGGGKKMDRQFSRRCRKYLRRQKDAPVVDVPFVMAAHWMISRGCLMETGGFSPAFVQYGEDDNYIDRARWKGYACGVVRAAGGVHDRAGRPASPEKRMFLKCNGSVARVSRPAFGALFRLLWETVRLALTGMVHFSKEPFRFIGTLWKRFPELMRYRRQSRKRGAFLQKS
ncbi:MAG: glycosyltransferase [Bacteroidales bacterium]|nr:glycosyltransferase [Bacteroidales bacterium]